MPNFNPGPRPVPGTTWSDFHQQYSGGEGSIPRFVAGTTPVEASVAFAALQAAHGAQRPPSPMATIERPTGPEHPPMPMFNTSPRQAPERPHIADLRPPSPVVPHPRMLVAELLDRVLRPPRPRITGL